ncbi:MAG TPA: hypothetical protein ENL06_02565 [Candidatus Portnoybacteria bacterium]|nr:hypothetical protein [Candidatus Portnoybacteria bacterium]
MIERKKFNLPKTENNSQDNIERLPYQQWRNIVALYRKTSDKKKFIEVMKKGGIEINGENITPVDFFSSNPGLSNEEIEEAIELYLGINQIENNLELFNQALGASIKYTQEYRHKDFPKEIKNLQISNLTDVIKIFRRTATLKKGQPLGLAPAYCDLIKTMVAEFEYRKKELTGLINESKFVYRKMFQRDKNDIQFFHFARETSDGYDQIGVFDNYSSGWINAYSSFRGKSEYSFISKFLQKPEATAEEAAKDGIGLKFEVNTLNEVKKIVPFLAGYLEKNFKAKDFVLENTRLLSKNEIEEVKNKTIEYLLANLENRINELKRNEAENKDKIIELEMRLKKYQDNPDKILMIKESDNPHSNPNFKSFKISHGWLKLPKNGEEGGMIINRRFEAQVVLVNNENESGFSHHSIYEASKKLAIETRETGSFTQKYLDIICREASQKSGLSAQRIEKFFKDNFLSEIIIKGKPAKVTRYAVKRNILKLIKAEMFPKTVKIKN